MSDMYVESSTVIILYVQPLFDLKKIEIQVMVLNI